MAFCRNCGATLKSGTKYCTSCGSPIPEEDMAKYGNDEQNNTQQSTYAPPSDQQPAQNYGNGQNVQTQYYYSGPPAPAPKKKKNHLFAEIVIGLVIIGIIIAVVLVFASGILNTDVKPTVEYDNGFQEVICEEENGYLVYTPVMKDGYIFDYWILPDGSKCTDKILSMTKGTGTIKGFSAVGYTVTVYGMFGIDISGNGDYKSYKTATLKASNDVANFIGWYSVDGTCLSTETTYVVPVKTNTVILAASDSTKYVGDASLKADISSTSIVPSTSSWYVMDGSVLVYYKSGASNINLNINPGVYKILVTGKNSAGGDESTTMEKEVDGTYKLTYSWTYKLTNYEITWTVPYNTYKLSKEKSVDRAPSTTSERREYVTTALPDNVVVDYLKTKSASMDEEGRANFVLKFVQLCFWYQLDYDYNESTEYWKYSLETMVDQRGDCEDTAILYCHLMRELGHKTALLLFEGEYYTNGGHAASGLNTVVDIAGGTYYEVDGTKYYYCETTSNTYNVGKAWDEYKDHCTVITIPQKA